MIGDGEPGIPLTDVDHLFWPVYRLATQRVATLRELDDWYSIDDVMDMNDALDALVDAEASRPRK